MRKAEFDRAEVLRSAMQVFQQKGYSKSTMQDLVSATGLHPGSLYCAFKNKRGILMAVADQYATDKALELEQFFIGKTPLQGVAAYLQSVIEVCASCAADSGCLIAKSMNELAEQDQEIQDLLTDIMSRAERRVEQAFEQAVANQQIAIQPDAKSRAQFFMMGIYGLRTYAHTHPSPAVLQQLADKLFQSISQ